VSINSGRKEEEREKKAKHVVHGHERQLHFFLIAQNERRMNSFQEFAEKSAILFEGGEKAAKERKRGKEICQRGQRGSKKKKKKKTLRTSWSGWDEIFASW
jgi:hypothetical protein